MKNIQDGCTQCRTVIRLGGTRGKRGMRWEGVRNEGGVVM